MTTSRALLASLVLLMGCPGEPSGDEPTPTPDPETDCDACSDGEICVFADLDATEPSCLDPRPDWYDDGTDEAKHFEDAGDGWFRKRMRIGPISAVYVYFGACGTRCHRPVQSCADSRCTWMAVLRCTGAMVSSLAFFPSM